MAESHASVTGAFAALANATLRYGLVRIRIARFTALTYIPGTRIHRLYQRANVWAQLVIDWVDESTDGVPTTGIVPLPRNPFAIEAVVGRLLEYVQALNEYAAGRPESAREFIDVGAPITFGRHWADDLLRETTEGE